MPSATHSIGSSIEHKTKNRKSHMYGWVALDPFVRFILSTKMLIQPISKISKNHIDNRRDKPIKLFLLVDQINSKR
jgi:hypothetical protein